MSTSVAAAAPVTAAHPSVKWAWFAIAIAVGSAVGLMPTPQGLTHNAQLVLAIVAFAIVLWAAEVMNNGVASILMMALLIAVAKVPPSRALSGFSDPAFIPNAGDLAQGAINRSAFDIGKPGSSSYIVDQMFKAKYGRDLDDTSARWLQGFFVLAYAINQAGSTEPEKIQAALKATDLKPDQLIMGYNGVKFDATGQNVLSATYLIQLQGKQYVSVWPADRATAKLELPMKGWHK